MLVSGLAELCLCRLIQVTVSSTRTFLTPTHVINLSLFMSMPHIARLGWVPPNFDFAFGLVQCQFTNTMDFRYSSVEAALYFAVTCSSKIDEKIIYNDTFRTHRFQVLAHSQYLVNGGFTRFEATLITSNKLF